MSRQYSQFGNEHPSNECAALESVLTAFFDGECSAGETHIARSHLEACSKCAEAWQQWQSTRSLFQSVPQSSAPVSLLARVRLACRRNSESVAQNPSEMSLRDQLLLEETLLEAERGWEPEPFVPPLRNFFAEVAPPAALKAAILESTVGNRVEVARGAEKAETSQSLWEALQSTFAPRALRWGGAIAVPAVAAWLLISLPSPQSVQAPEKAKSLVARSTSTPAFRLPNVEEAKELLKSSPLLAKRSTVEARDEEAEAKAAEAEAASRRSIEHRTFASSEATSTPSPAGVRLVSLTPTSASPSSTAAQLPSTKLPKSASPSTGGAKTPQKIVRVSSRPRPRRVPQVTIATHFRRSERVGLGAQPSVIRTSVGRHHSLATAPQPAAVPSGPDPSLIASRFREDLIEFSRLRDGRDDEFKSVVNEYRATLAEDAVDADEEWDEDVL